MNNNPTDKQIKVCGITRESDLLSLASIGVDYAGFNFYEKSPRFAERILPASKIRDLQLPLKKVGVFVNDPLERILSLVSSYGLDLVQLHGDESVETTRMIRKHVPVIKAFRISEEFDFPQSVQPFLEVCDFFLFDSPGKYYGGNQVVFNWGKMKSYLGGVPFFLSGGIGNQHILALAQFQHPSWMAVDVNSQFEIAPGIKNIEMVRKFKQDFSIKK
ncbi:MAG: phosphoribosylanthranilate isomerase [Chitinophagaceae bacterium]